jgi:hypothetical protein
MKKIARLETRIEKKREEGIYFAYSATLRIFGVIPELNDISIALSLQPTHSHRRGEGRSKHTALYPHDMWSYSPPVAKSEPLYMHIDALWHVLKPHKKYLLELKKSVTVDVFLGYRSNCDNAGVEVPYSSLEMFSELEIPFGLSVIIA